MDEYYKIIKPYISTLLIFLLVNISIKVFARDSLDERIKIAVLDTGIRPDFYYKNSLCKTGHKDFTGFGINDYHGHGTNIAHLIAQKINYKTHCLIIVKWFHLKFDSIAYLNSLKYISIIKPAYLNASIEGPSYSPLEYDLYKKILINDTMVIAAAGNSGVSLDLECNSFPACYRFKTNKFKVITSCNKQGIINLPKANVGKVISGCANGVSQCDNRNCMNGTSQATANYTGFLISNKTNIGIYNAN